jgi:Ca-activated chloride channel family protein
MEFSKNDDLQPAEGGSFPAGELVHLDARAERALIRPKGGDSHVVFVVRVSALERPPTDRAPLAVALVVDRSGSMAGEKLPGARRAALAVLAGLDERDQAAVVVFDDRIDVIQPLQVVTPAFRASCRTGLEAIQARGSTALHDGWVTGVQAIASTPWDAQTDRLARCFLLTDGIANVGLTDPERIATQAAAVLRETRIATSTFGVGADYNEFLLGPLAVAGGGQFHHLRSVGEMATTFAGELGDLLAVAAAGVRLEIEADPGISVEVVSTYRDEPDAQGTHRIHLGDLLANEERRLVVRCYFPPQASARAVALRARLTWNDRGTQKTGPWQTTQFVYASIADCDAESPASAILHDVGIAHATRAQREATSLARRGDVVESHALLTRVAGRIAKYAGDDADLRSAVEELRELDRQISQQQLNSVASKEVYYRSQNRSRGQRDKRV